MFRRLLCFLTKTWVLALIIVLALALLVWFAGPLVAIAGYVPLASPVARLATILVLLLGWGLNNLRLRNARAKADEKLADAVTEDAEQEAQGADQSEVQAEQAVLARQLKEAMNTLREARLARGRRLYDLPWYVIIGAPGSGKTTALQQSGLHFPLQSEMGAQPVKGAGGTRYCDWWFTDEAVLLDTAGRYTTQDDPKQVETRAWRGFLDLLRKARPKRPLNGVIVTVSVLDLLNKTDTQLAMQGAAIKHRVQELNEQLAMDLPVYVIFTKCDLLAGFNEFFADLGQEDREQVWGVTFHHTRARDTGGALERLPDEIEALAARLDDRLLQRLDHEREPRRNALIYEFPRQVLALRERLEGFLRDMFVPNQFERPALLRGVYLASGTQTATAGQRVTGVVPPALCQPSVSAEASVPKAFFLKRLLRDVIFGEAQLATSSDRARRRFRWSAAALTGLTLAAFIGAVGAWYTSHQANHDYLTRVVEHVDDYETSTDGVLSPGTNRDWQRLAAGLDALRALPRGYDGNPDDAPWRMGFGLYQGHKVGAQARRTYLDALERFFMPSLASSLARRIQPDGDDPQRLYEALRFYLMLYNPEHRDDEELQLWARLMWRNALPGERAASVRRSLQDHLRAALSEGVQPPPMDEELVARAREVLAETPLARRAYRRLKREYMAGNDDAFTLKDVIGSTAEVIFYRRSDQSLDEGVSRFFTYKYFHTGFNVASGKLAERLAGERWIYGDEATGELSDERLEEIKEEVRELYFNEYVSRWRAFLEDVRVRPFRNASEGHEVLRVLASSEQPLVEVLQAIRRHTALSEPPETSEGAAEAAEAVSDEAMPNQTRRLERLVPDDAAEGATPSLPGGQVTSAFIGFNDYVSTDEGVPLERLQTALEELKTYLDRLAYSSDIGREAFQASRDGDDPVTALRQALADAPPVVQNWFADLPSSARQVNAGATEDHINNAWQSEVVGFYRDSIAGRYPVTPDAGREIRLEDFKRFFGPGGILQGYFRQYVAPFVDTTGPRWRWTTDVAITDDALALFQRARRIRQAYFRDGEEPSASFVVRPYTMDAAVTSSLLELAGTRIEYRHGPVRSSVVEWPGDGINGARVVLNPGSGRTPLSRRTRGPWSLFRLLDRAAAVDEMEEGDAYRIEFELDGAEASYIIRPRSVHHPFGDNPLKGFALPEEL
ncbi:type VI secretion system membrane subunit TssM [Aquisalimonas lutea]|uniref:type VI secretion system membrane subunit TssM n=1 Tax=Aquisalimonas lutea TaxID=1327750 RepID=UPI0025B5C7ED|nr:type VI secretion system membrane subunit TssM [Aquisalimonas lutea]MDN3519588.1 type VI secretion system membrane subunit TssM [Aquisalimonas lutea]